MLGRQMAAGRGVPSNRIAAVEELVALLGRQRMEQRTMER